MLSETVSLVSSDRLRERSSNNTRLAYLSENSRLFKQPETSPQQKEADIFAVLSL